ncbi:hypothetical protein [Amylibacter sp. IMCC11727]|uniref:hypothetical protein n=1 Tax=Amylibacter sp. IMCC11727 TaxID=3039851 RepID=UPI00244DE352|nr:hypothetical protein [Amylibacter sp. IMCC11727]WGI20940.1 hypothetical protein QBD29_12570 [Amylibacter sp. IMCC11727]
MEATASKHLSKDYRDSGKYKNLFKGKSFVEGYLLALGLEGGSKTFNETKSFKRLEQLTAVRNAFQHQSTLGTDVIYANEVKTRRNSKFLFSVEHENSEQSYFGQQVTLDEKILFQIVDDLRSLSSELKSALYPWR